MATATASIQGCRSWACPSDCGARIGDATRTGARTPPSTHPLLCLLFKKVTLDHLGCLWMWVLAFFEAYSGRQYVAEAPSNRDGSGPKKRVGNGPFWAIWTALTPQRNRNGQKGVERYRRTGACGQRTRDQGPGSDEDWHSNGLRRGLQSIQTVPQCPPNAFRNAFLGASPGS